MVTMSQIAERAGVSAATVSFVLNKRDTAVRISERTRQRVLEAADEMGYRQNGLARAVATGKNLMLGFLVTKPEYEPVSRMLAGALDESEAVGYTLKVLRVRDDALDRETVERCADLRLAGVITMYVREAALHQLHQEMTRYHIPLAVLDSSFAHPWGVRVVSDDLQGCRLVVEHLRALGHRRIAFVSGDPKDGVAITREDGFVAAMQGAGLKVPEGYVQRGFWDAHKMAEATRLLLRHASGAPTAIACASDETAMVVTRTLRREGLETPRDVSVTGFSDLHAAQYFDPPLTTIAPPFAEMGRIVVRRLLERAHQERDSFRDEPLEERLSTQLVTRESTGPVAA